MTNPAAWHPDPTGKHDHRWWDGERWTEHVADAGQASIDPLDAGGPSQTGTTGGSVAADEGASAGWAGEGGDTATPDTATPDRGQHPDQADPSSDAGQWQQPDRSQPEAGASGGAWGQPSAGEPTWQQPASSGPTWQQPAAGAPTWQQPAAGAAPAGSDGLAIAAMIVGILSLLTSWLVIGALGGIVAIVLGFLARGRLKQSGREGNGLAITGIVTGFLAVIIGGIVLALGAWLFTTTDGIGGTVSGYIECLEETDGDQEFCDNLLEEELLDRFGG